MCDKERDIKIAHLEKIRDDVRDEIKRRIGQRDSYSMQLTIASGTIMAIAFSAGRQEILILLPLVSIYYIVLIMYSYEIHRFAAQYLRDEIEPKLAELCGTPNNIEWETYYKGEKIAPEKTEKEAKVPGIRRLFFLAWMVIITVVYICYVWLSPVSNEKFCKIILIIISATYFFAMICILVWQKHIFKEFINSIKENGQVSFRKIIKLLIGF